MMTTMKVLWPLLLIETVNFLLHRLLRPADSGAIVVDTVALLVTAAVMFAAGWIVVSRRIGGITLGILAGIVIWAFSNLILSAGFALLFESTSQGSADPEQGFVLRGVVTGALLLLPAAVIVAAAGGLVARRWKT